MLFGKYRYVVVEGPIGAGKTSLARRLAEHFQCALLLEQPDENPFLPRFYEDISRHALPTQLYFLFQRSRQAADLMQLNLFSPATVADFMLEKDPLFAKLTLSDEEYDLYQQVFRHLKPQAPDPDLVIYLQASPEILVQRVKRRGVDYERNISPEYLFRLAEGYSRFFYRYEASPLLIVNSDNLNIVDDAGDFDLLLGRVAAMRSQREFFNRGV